MQNEEQPVNEQVEESKDDSGNFNLTDELVAFNKESVEGSPEPEEESVDMAESDDNNEEVDTKTEEPSPEEVSQWLIDNKFKDDDEGKHKLADSYRSLQSEYDKLKNTDSSMSKEAEDAIEFAKWVANNEDARNAINEVANKPEVSAIDVPEDFDQLEIYTEGTSSNEWYKAVQSQQREQLRNEVLGDVKKEFDQRDNEVKERNEAREMVAYLQSEHDMDETEVSDYLSFIQDEQSFSTNNLVSLFKASKGSQPPNKNENPESKPRIKDIPAGVNAATAGGVNPPASKNPVDDLMDSLLGHSKRDFSLE
tara:strand:+ start:313 stop:1239 length:927 start_codon:yes stop_codon:yes gene_type:complete